MKFLFQALTLIVFLCNAPLLSLSRFVLSDKHLQTIDSLIPLVKQLDGTIHQTRQELIPTLEHFSPAHATHHMKNIPLMGFWFITGKYALEIIRHHFIKLWHAHSEQQSWREVATIHCKDCAAVGGGIILFLVSVVCILKTDALIARTSRIL